MKHRKLRKQSILPKYTVQNNDNLCIALVYASSDFDQRIKNLFFDTVYA